MPVTESRRMDPAAIVLAALVGATGWISLGALAVTSERVVRLGVLAPFWMLPTLIAIAGGVAAATKMPRSAAWALAPVLVLWLPWLPIQIPAAFLIWEGPLEAPVWIAAGLGAVVAWFNDDRAAWLPPWLFRSPRALVVVAFAGSLVAALVLARAHQIPGGDEPHYLIITQSLLNDGDLRIQNNHERGDYFAYYDDGLPPDFLRRGTDGQIYSVHAFGVSVLLLPAFAIGGYPAAVVFVALLSALGLGLAWRAALGLTDDPGAATAGALAVFTSATVFFHSFAIFPDPVGGAIVAAALTMLVRLHASPHEVPRWQLAGVGVLIGLLPFLHTRFAVIAAALGVVFAGRLWARADRLRALAVFAAGPSVLAPAWFGYFYLIYGTPNPAAPYGNSQQNDPAWIAAGLAGLLFDQQFGAIIAAPVLSFATYGMFVIWRLSPRLAIELLAIVGPYTLVVASFGMWWGGWSAPARFLDALMPVAVPLLALAWRNAGRTLRGVFAALVLVSIANLLARLFVLNGSLLHNSRDGFDLLLDWLSRNVNIPLTLPSVHRSGPQVAMLATAAWAAVAALGLALLALWNRGTRSRGAQWGSTATVICATVMAAMSTTAGVTGAPVVTPQSSKAEFIRRWHPSLRPTAVQLPSLRLSGVDAAVAGLDLATSARARDLMRGRPLLAIPWVPAGDYRVAIEGAAELAGTLTVSVGQTSQPLEVWPLEGQTAGLTTLRIRLPALAQSVVIRADDQARARITRLTLRPDALQPSPSGGNYIIRSARYGQARAFFLDDEIYMEPGGVWTRGDSTSRFYVTSDTEAGTVPIDVIAGPVPTHVEWRSGAWQITADLVAGERRQFEVVVGSLLEFGARGAFRPVDVDPGSDDRRRLGVRLEVPGSAAGGQ